MNQSFEPRSTDGIRRRPASRLELSRREKMETEIIPEEDIILTSEDDKDSQNPKEELILSTPLPYDQFKEEKWWSRMRLPSTGWTSALTQRWASLSGGRSRLLFWGVGGGVITFVALVLLISFIFSRVSLTLKPKVESIALDHIVLTFDSAVSGISATQRVLPAERLEFKRSVSDNFASSGKKFVEERAVGTAKIYNRFSSSPQPLVARTRFSTDSGVLYRIQKGVTVPGAKIEEGKIVPQFIEAGLVADETGEIGNLSGEVMLKIPGFKDSPKYEGFYAVASSGFSGGFVGETTVVSKEDIKKAEEAVTQRVYQELEEEMKRNILPGFKFIESLREIQITKTSVPRELTREETFRTEAEARGRVIIFREQDVIGLLRELLLEDDATTELMEGSASFSYQVSNVDFDKGKAALAISGSINSKSVLPREEVIASVLGKKEGSLIEVLKNRKDLTSFRISFFPPWISKAPEDVSKIRIFIESPGD